MSLIQSCLKMLLRLCRVGSVVVTVVDPADLMDPVDLSLRVGESASLRGPVVTFALDDAYVYASNDEQVATVDDRGVVTAVGAGTCEVSVYSDSSLVAPVSYTHLDVYKRQSSDCGWRSAARIASAACWPAALRA